MGRVAQKDEVGPQFYVERPTERPPLAVLDADDVGPAEFDAFLRAEMGERLRFLGIAVDAAQNAAARADADVSAEGADVRTLVVAAREDLEIARQVRHALE